ncbi:MAG: hypothetical protein V4805_16475 [Pseudomonadota bacterium]
MNQPRHLMQESDIGSEDPPDETIETAPNIPQKQVPNKTEKPSAETVTQRRQSAEKTEKQAAADAQSAKSSAPVTKDRARDVKGVMDD